MNPKEVRMYIVVNSDQMESDLIRIIAQTVARQVLFIEQNDPDNELYREWKFNLYPKIVTELPHKCFSRLLDSTITLDPSGSVAVFSPLRYKNRPPLLKRAKLLRDDLRITLGSRPERGRSVIDIDFNQDVKMSVGKLSAQVAHSLSNMVEYLAQSYPEILEEWAKGGYALILNGRPASELAQLIKTPRCVWTVDAGRTEIPSGTLTTVAYFPKYML